MDENAFLERVHTRIGNLLEAERRAHGERYQDMRSHFEALLGRHHSPLESVLDRLERRQEHQNTLLERLLTMTAELVSARNDLRAGLDAQGNKLTTMANALSDATAATQAKLDAMTTKLNDLEAKVAAGDPDVPGVVSGLKEDLAVVVSDNQKIDDATTTLQTVLGGGATPAPQPDPQPDPAPAPDPAPQPDPAPAGDAGASA